jgi:hypothetical protein
MFVFILYDCTSSLAYVVFFFQPPKNHNNNLCHCCLQTHLKPIVSQFIVEPHESLKLVPHAALVEEVHEIVGISSLILYVDL